MVATDIAIIIAVMIIVVIIAGCVRIVAIVMERSMAIANCYIKLFIALTFLCCSLQDF